MHIVPLFLSIGLMKIVVVVLENLKEIYMVKISFELKRFWHLLQK